MRHTHSRAQRFGGHTKHTFYCSCGRQVSGNGGKQHFKLDGHKRVSWDAWKAAQSDETLHLDGCSLPGDHDGDCDA